MFIDFLKWHNLIDEGRERRELFAQLSILSFAFSLISVFVPIYLYTLGYSLASIALYFFLERFCHLVFFFPAGKAISRFGAKHVILFSIPLMLVYLGVLFWMTDNSLSVVVPALLFGFSRSIYWNAVDLEFSLYTNRKNRGESVGYFYALPDASKIIGPLLGGILITFFGFHILFALTALISMLSAIPLFLSPDLVYAETKGWAKAFKRDFIRSFVGSLVLGSRIICILFLWPLFLHLKNISFETIGLAYSFSGLLVVLFTLYVGRKTDRKYSPRWVSFGAIASSFCWAIAFFVTGTLYALAITTLIALTTSLWLIPLEKYIFNEVKKTNVFGGLLVRKAGRVTGSALILLVFFAVMLFAGPMAAFGYAFFFNAFLFLYPLVLRALNRSFFP